MLAKVENISVSWDGRRKKKNVMILHSLTNVLISSKKLLQSLAKLFSSLCSCLGETGSFSQGTYARERKSVKGSVKFKSIVRERKNVSSRLIVFLSLHGLRSSTPLNARTKNGKRRIY